MIFKRFVADSGSSPLRYNPLLYGRPHWGAKEKKGRTGVKDEKDISDSGGGGCAVVGGVCGR